MESESCCPSVRQVDLSCFALLPSLALEDVFWYHVVDAAVAATDSRASAVAGTIEIDVYHINALRSWLGRCYRLLRGSPEFCLAVRRLLCAWECLVDTRWPCVDDLWRGVAPPLGRGTITSVFGGACSGKTTALIRIARVLAKHDVFTVIVYRDRTDDLGVCLGLGRSSDVNVYWIEKRMDEDAGTFWARVSPILHEHARGGVLLVGDNIPLGLGSLAARTMVEEIARLGVHVITTQVSPCDPALVPYIDRIVWCCGTGGTHYHMAHSALFGALGVSRERLCALERRCTRGNAKAVIAQRHSGGAWVTRLMPRAETRTATQRTTP
nr:hypothetical protein [Pandoravirus massiliensis]